MRQGAKETSRISLALELTKCMSLHNELLSKYLAEDDAEAAKAAAIDMIQQEHAQHADQDARLDAAKRFIKTIASVPTMSAKELTELRETDQLREDVDLICGYKNADYNAATSLASALIYIQQSEEKAAAAEGKGVLTAAAMGEIEAAQAITEAEAAADAASDMGDGDMSEDSELKCPSRPEEVDDVEPSVGLPATKEVPTPSESKVGTEFYYVGSEKSDTQVPANPPAKRIAVDAPKNRKEGEWAVVSDANSATEDLSIGGDTLAAGFEKLGVLGGDDRPVKAAQPQASLLAAMGLPVETEPLPTEKRGKRAKKSRPDETEPTTLMGELRQAEKRTKKKAKKIASPDGDAQ